MTQAGERRQKFPDGREELYVIISIIEILKKLGMVKIQRGRKKAILNSRKTKKAAD